jgi:hypothetical protein
VAVAQHTDVELLKYVPFDARHSSAVATAASTVLDEPSVCKSRSKSSNLSPSLLIINSSFHKLKLQFLPKNVNIFLHRTQ